MSLLLFLLPIPSHPSLSPSLVPTAQEKHCGGLVLPWKQNRQVQGNTAPWWEVSVMGFLF